MIDVLFDPSTAEWDSSGSMAEFYAPGSTRAINPTEPLIERVLYRNSHFRPLAEDGTELHAIISVSIKQWRHHEEPLRSREAQLACIAESISSKSEKRNCVLNAGYALKSREIVSEWIG
ncbi:hypothetical protein A0U91_17105 (plasmid) [Acetobacter persici]|uniref:Uncharacterized protein n=1 Tax=Acetobacter persici TaxID=1076596 RepID=A0A1U9LJX5_9PROT|nr:hypothetical protein A0U91_17105 [Acetobacter persici]